MADNEKIIIEVVPELQLAPIERKYLEFKDDLKKLKAAIREDLKFELGIIKPSAKDVNAIANQVIAEAKRIEKEEKASYAKRTVAHEEFLLKQVKDADATAKMLLAHEKEQTNKELAELRQRLDTKHKWQKEQVALIRSTRVAEAKAEEQFNKQIAAQELSELRQRIATKHNYRQAELKRIRADREAEAKAEIQLNKMIENSRTKLNIGATGAKVAPSGDFSSLRDKKEYTTGTSSALNFTAQEKEYKRLDDAMKRVDATSKNTFPHKISTTAQYMAAGALIGGVTTALYGMVGAIVETNKATTSFEAILFSNSKTTEEAKAKAEALQKSIFDVGSTYGANLKDLEETALSLGRAGVSGRELAEAMKVVGQASVASGESMEGITEMFTAWHTVFPDKTFKELGDAITYAANSSLASIGGIKTMTSYVLTSGKAAGLTSNSILALISSMKDLGAADSIVGTTARRFFEQLENSNTKTKNAYRKLGVDVDEVSKKMKLGPKEAESAMTSMMGTLGKATKEQVKNAIQGIGTLEASSITAVTELAPKYEKKLRDIQLLSHGVLEDTAGKMSLSYENFWNRIKNIATEGSSELEKSFRESFSGGNASIEETQKKMQEFRDTIVGSAQTIGKAIGNISKFIVENKDAIELVIEAWITYKAIVYTSGLSIAIASIATTVGTVTSAINSATKAQGLFNLAVLRNPWVIGAVALGTIAYGANASTGSEKKKFSTSKELGTAGHEKDLATISAMTGAQAQYNEALRLTGTLKGKVRALDAVILKDNKSGKESLENKFQREGFIERISLQEKLNKNLKEAARLENTSKNKPGVDPLNLIPEGKTPKKAADNTKDIYAAEIARLKLKEVDYFWNEKITSELEQQAYHIEKTIPAMRTAAEKIADKEKREKAISDLTREGIETQRKSADYVTKATIELDKQEVLTRKSANNIGYMSEYSKVLLDQKEEELAIAEKLAQQDKAFGTTKEGRVLYERARADADKQREIAGKKAIESTRVLATTAKLSAENELYNLKVKSELEANSYTSSLGYMQEEIALADIKNEQDKQKYDIFKANSDELELHYGNLVVSQEAQTKAELVGLDSIGSKKIQILALDEIALAYQREKETGHKVTQEQLDVIIAKYAVLASKLSSIDISAGFKKAATEFDNMFKPFDKFIESMDKIANLSENTNKTFSKMSKGMMGLSKSSISLGKIEQKNADRLKDAGTDADKIAAAKRQNTADEIQGYSDVAGAMAGFFEAGSDGAKAFQAIQAALAIVGAVTTITNATASAGPAWPAVLAASTAAMAGVLSLAGIAFGRGSVKTSSDAFSAQKANTGTGTVFGDSEKQSESIANSLSIMEGLAEPQLQYITQMAKSLYAIENNISGLTTGILKYQGFATGAGTKGSSSSFSNVNNTLVGNSMSGGIAGGAALGMAFGPIGAYVGSIAGTVLGPLINKLPLLSSALGEVGSAVGKIDKAIFGGSLFGGESSTFLKDAGLKFQTQLIDAALGGLDAQAYQTWQTDTSGGMFSSDKSSKKTIYGEADNKLTKAYQDIINSLYDITVTSAKAFKIPTDSIITNMESYQLAIGKISMKVTKKHTAEDIQKEIEAVFSKISDQMAIEAYGIGEDFVSSLVKPIQKENQSDKSFAKAMEKYQTKYDEEYATFLDNRTTELDEFQIVGEGLGETLSRVSSQSSVVGETFKNLGIDINGSIMDISNDMTTFAGGLDNFQQSFSSYYDNYYSDIEKLVNNQAIISDVFKDLGIAIPKTTEDFRVLTNAYLAGDTASIELGQSLVEISELFYDVAEASRVSSANIQDWKDSFKTSDQLAGDLANTLGVTLAKDITELNMLFNTLSLGIDGLTDSELEFLNANKTYIEGLQELETKRIADAEEAYKDNINAQIDATKKASNARLDALKAEKSAMDKIRTSIDAITKTAKSIRDSALSGITISSGTYKDTYETIRKAMISGMDYSQYTSDFNSYAMQYASDIKESAKTESEYLFETMKLANEVEALAGNGSRSANLWDVEAAILHEEQTLEAAINNLTAQLKLDAMSSSSAVTTSSSVGHISGTASIDTVGTSPINTISYVGDIGATNAKSVLDTIPTHYDDIFAKYGVGMDMYQWIPYNSGFGQLLSTWGALSGKAIPEMGITKLDTIEEIKAYYSSMMSNSVEGMGIYNSSRDAMKALALMGYKSGGYTGDMGVNSIAGLVHGQEYVVNAKTTQDLGLNNSGGVFKDMVGYMRSMQNEMRNMSQTMFNILRETAANNAGIRNVTNGYSAMMIEVI